MWFQKAGPWGGVLFVGAYACLQPFGVNGLVFLLSAPLIWTPTEAFLLNWAGTIGTGLFSFLVARFVARDWIQQRLPRIRRFDERLQTNGFRTVFLLRLIFYTTPTVQWALGVSRGRLRPVPRRDCLGRRALHLDDDAGGDSCRKMDRRAPCGDLALGPTLAFPHPSRSPDRRDQHTHPTQVASASRRLIPGRGKRRDTGLRRTGRLAEVAGRA